MKISGVYSDSVEEFQADLCGGVIASISGKFCIPDAVMHMKVSDLL